MFLQEIGSLRWPLREWFNEGFNRRDGESTNNFYEGSDGRDGGSNKSFFEGLVQ